MLDISEIRPAKRTGRWTGWGLAASLALHLLIVLPFVMSFALSDPPPEKEESVSVELVPPEPERPQEPQKEPESKKEEKKAEAPPPPQEQKPPPLEKTEPLPSDREKAPPLPTLQQVFRFGERNAGPEKKLDGDSADEGQPEATVDEPDDATKAQDLAKLVSKAPDVVVESEAPKLPEIAIPEVAPSAANGALSGEAGEASALPVPKPVEKPQVTNAPLPKKPVLKQAKRLYSEEATGSMVAMMAAAGVPRGQRASQLCTSELKEQLKRSTPSYNAEYLPDVRSEKDTVLEPPKAAFRASGTWYDVHFRCEVDKEATRVVSFALSVGKPVPRRQWAGRKFPRN